MTKIDKNTIRQSAIKPWSDADMLLLGMRASQLILALYWQSEQHFHLAKTLIQREFTTFLGEGSGASSLVDSTLRRVLLNVGYPRIVEPKPILVHLPEKATITDFGWLFIGLLLHHFSERGLFLVPLSAMDMKHLDGLPKKTLSINLSPAAEKQIPYPEIPDNFVETCLGFHKYLAIVMSNKYNRYQMTHFIRQWAKAYDMEIIKAKCPQKSGVVKLDITVLLSNEET